MQTATFTAKDIHADFYGAEERLFVEAIGLAKSSGPNKSLTARYAKIGFGNVKAIGDAKQLESKKALSESMIAAIEYFRVYYPNYKFITEAEVKKLCDKYGLLLGDAKNFTGDMPEKNLVNIEKFSLRKEDWQVKKETGLFTWFQPSAQPSDIDSFGFIGFSRRRSGQSQQRDLMDMYYAQMQSALGITQGIDPYSKKKASAAEKEQPAFKICAPKEDFNTLGYVVQDGYRLVYDPIVLQPVAKNDIEGYLIVDAWGDEASDELVINQTNN